MGSRVLTAAVKAELVKTTIRPAYFVLIEFSTGTLRLWSGVGEKSWDGETWQGAGELLSLSPVVETAEVRAVGLSIGLSGLPSALVSLVLGAAERGRPVSMWIAFLDDNWNIIADPYKSFSGRFDTLSIEEGPDSSTIAIQAENRLIDLERPRARRYNQQDQHIDFPNDKGFEYVPGLQEQTIIWGRG